MYVKSKARQIKTKLEFYNVVSTFCTLTKANRMKHPKHRNEITESQQQATQETT